MRTRELKSAPRIMPLYARAAAPLENSTIVEIGPGPGGLTRALLALGAARVIAIEHDERAIPALQEVSARYPGRLEIVHADAIILSFVDLPMAVSADGYLLAI